MKCLEPVLVGYSFGRKANGDVRFVGVKGCRPELVDDRLFIFGKEASPIYVGCGKCPFCVKAKKRDITTRIVHEARNSEAAWFVTLTYNPTHLPSDGSLVKRDVQLFLKRLRKARPNDHIRYMLVGEYGKLHLRPHYHMILFGLPDMPLVFHECRCKYDVYRSPLIERCWTLGFSTLTRFDYSNARYVAQYCQKKADIQDLPSGLERPFMLGSRGKCGEGAIGAPWFDRWHTEMLRDGFCVLRVNGHSFKVPLPRYYLRRARERYHEEWLKLVLSREEYLMSHFEELPTSEDYAEYLASLESEARTITKQESDSLSNRRYENDN